jgi:hypothetical protein
VYNSSTGAVFGISVSGAVPSVQFASAGTSVSGFQSVSLAVNQTVALYSFNGAQLNTAGSGSYTGIAAELSIKKL